MKFGYQLSSVTPYLQTEVELREAMQKIAEIGYEWVQLQGASYSIPNKAIADAMKDAGLRCVAMQEDFPTDFGDKADRAIERATECGCGYLTFAAFPCRFETVEDVERYADSLIPVCEKAKAAGLVLCFHPIGPDFRPMDGVPVYERLLSLLPSDVQLTFCVRSCFGSGLQPADILKKHAGRVDLVHFKEAKTQPDGRPQLVPLGEGDTDWASIASDCERASVKYVFAEQERWERDAFDCAAASYRYLTDLGCFN